MSRWICRLNECIRLIQPNGIKAKPSSLMAMNGPLMPLKHSQAFCRRLQPIPACRMMSRPIDMALLSNAKINT